MIRTLDITVSALLVLAGIGFFAMTFGEAFNVPTFGGDVGPAFVPRLFLIAWILLSAAVLVQALRGANTDAPATQLGQMAAIIAIALATALAMTEIGFVFATVPGFALFCWAFRYRRIVPLAAISIGAPLVIWALFTFGFELLLPRSPWFHSI